VPLCSKLEAAEFISGKSVAIVCNAPEIMNHIYGEEIDSHDVVIRINRGWPGKDNWKSLGRRTDMLAGGVFEPLRQIPFTPKWIWWFKHTELGAKDLARITTMLIDTKVWHKPLEEQMALAVQTGGLPSSGPNTAASCKEMGAKSVTIYGATCWGALERGAKTHWWKYPESHAALANMQNPHSAQKEAVWFVANTTNPKPLVRVMK
jgi:hypothetical protein